MYIAVARYVAKASFCDSPTLPFFVPKRVSLPEAAELGAKTDQSVPKKHAAKNLAAAFEVALGV